MDGIHFLDAKGPEGMRLYAIGDVHGRLDLLTAILERIEPEAKTADDWRVILLGDYIDRGPDSKGVLELLVGLRDNPNYVLLGGNHDFGFLDFLERPRALSLFAKHGGFETASSYGVTPELTDDAAAKRTRDALLEAVPQSHLDLLESLKWSVESGDFFFCHAGIRPGVPLNKQDPDDLIWIREEFLNSVELHPKVVVHGHTPHAEPEVLANRVNVDTRAYQSDELTALSIFNDEKRLISVKAERPIGWL